MHFNLFWFYMETENWLWLSSSSHDNKDDDFLSDNQHQLDIMT